MLRKLLLVAASATLAGSGRCHEAFVAVVVLVACLAAQLYVKPYTYAADGRLETVSLVASASSLYLGLLFTLGNLEPAGEYVTVASLVAVNGLFAAVVVCHRCMQRAARVEPA